MGFNSAFKGLKLLRKPGNGRLKNLNDLVLNDLNQRLQLQFLISWWWAACRSKHV